MYLRAISKDKPLGGLYLEGGLSVFCVAVLGGLYMEGLIFGVLRYSAVIVLRFNVWRLKLIVRWKVLYEMLITKYISFEKKPSRSLRGCGFWKKKCWTILVLTFESTNNAHSKRICPPSLLNWNVIRSQWQAPIKFFAFITEVNLPWLVTQ